MLAWPVMTSRFLRISALALLLAWGAAGVACSDSKSASGAGTGGASTGGASTGGAGGEGPGDSSGGTSSSGGKTSSGGSAGENGGGGEAGDGGNDDGDDDEGDTGDEDDQFFSGQWIDHDGNLYLADTRNCVVRKVDPQGVITTVAGTPEDCGDEGDGGLATAAKLSYPADVAIGPDGDLYIADAGNYRVRRVDAETGIISAFAGTGEWGNSGDGGPAQNAELKTPLGLVVDREGSVFIADPDAFVVRKVDASDGTITTVAGTGTPGTSGNGGPATEANLEAPAGLALDASGSLYIGTFEWVRKVDLEEGTITSVAGTGNWGTDGDGGPALKADLRSVSGLGVDASGHLYVLDMDTHAVRKLDATTGLLTTVVGALGTSGSSGDGGLATSARLYYPGKVTLDRQGHLYIGDSYNHRIRKVNLETGIITTVVGTGASGFTGDGGPAGDAQLDRPFDVLWHWD